MDNLDERYSPRPDNNRQLLANFILTVSGFSFWFLIAVPFASHKESYSWLANAWHGHLMQSLEMIGVGTTWRPLAEFVTSVGFAILDPKIFPTSVVRQTVLQSLVYLMFVLAWAIIYSAAPQRKVLAIVALVAGGVFFPGYIHLFHVYGAFYAPVLVMLGIVLRFHENGCSKRQETIMALIAILLSLWHPFATAIFLGFYFGRYVSTLSTLDWRQHVRAWLVLSLGGAVVLTLLALSPRLNQTFNLLGFITSYRTNEINLIASITAWLLAYLTIVTMQIAARRKAILFAIVTILGLFFLYSSIPLLLLWIAVVGCKLICAREWDLLFVLFVTLLLPYSGGIGGPVYALFSIALAVFVTSEGWATGEERLRGIGYQYATAIVVVLALVALIVRGGMPMPLVSEAARPLLMERERTYQLEQTLSWLAASEYCSYPIAFADRGGNPVDDLENAITRRSRPPADIGDVTNFWNKVLRCKGTGTAPNPDDVIVIAFGDSPQAYTTKIFEKTGEKAGPVTAWIRKQ
jgi:hypothetical protein